MPPNRVLHGPLCWISRYQSAGFVFIWPKQLPPEAPSRASKFSNRVTKPQHAARPKGAPLDQTNKI